jgi:3-methyladenine DNA glycosylase AlkC
MEWKTLFDKQLVERIGDRIAGAYSEFDQSGFITEAVEGLDDLELKARSAHICAAFAKRLPADFSAAVEVLLQAMGEDDGSGGLEGFEGFHHMPFLDFVAAHGTGHPDTALDALERMTLFFSAEFAIRPFLARYPDKVMVRLYPCSRADDWRLRRFVSERTRPRLPWASRLPALIEDPSPMFDFLERLHDDPHLVVRRSVANHLNDIAKDHPDPAVELAASWAAKGGEEGMWTVRHGLRTLIKQGHPGALALLGYRAVDAVRVETLSLTASQVAIGDTLHFSFTLVSEERDPVKLVIDYALHRELANGKRGRKVFKLAKRTMAPGERVVIDGKQSFQQRSTRTYYPGAHAIEILINGQAAQQCAFEVVG